MNEIAKKIMLVIAVISVGNPALISAGWWDAARSVANSLVDDSEKSKYAVTAALSGAVVGFCAYNVLKSMYKRGKKPVEPKSAAENIKAEDSAHGVVSDVLPMPGDGDAAQPAEDGAAMVQEIRACNRELHQLLGDLEHAQEHARAVYEHERERANNLEQQQRELRKEIHGADPHDHPFAAFVAFGNKDTFEMVPILPQLRELKGLQGAHESKHDGDAFDDGGSGDEMSGSGVLIQKEDIPFKGPFTIEKYPVHKVLERTVREDLQGNGIIALLSVHGTWATAGSYGDNINKPTTQDIINFAEMVAISHNCAVEVIPFEWCGDLDEKKREEAGRALAHYILENSGRFKSIWALAHSHGCNVVTWAARALKDAKGRKIDRAIFMGSPISDAEIGVVERGVSHISKVYSLYGLHDFTAMAGTMASAGSMVRKLSMMSGEKGQVYNLCVKEQGKDLNHIDIKRVIQYLPWIIFSVDTYYDCFFDLTVNIGAPDRVSYCPMVAIRKQPYSIPSIVHENAVRGLRFSNAQQDKYREMFGNDINQSAHVFLRTLTAPLSEVVSVLSKGNRGGSRGVPVGTEEC